MKSLTLIAYVFLISCQPKQIYESTSTVELHPSPEIFEHDQVEPALEIELIQNIATSMAMAESEYEITHDEESNHVRFTVRNRDRELARKKAEEFANAYIKERNSLVSQRAQNALKSAPPTKWSKLVQKYTSP